MSDVVESSAEEGLFFVWSKPRLWTVSSALEASKHLTNAGQLIRLRRFLLIWSPTMWTQFAKEMVGTPERKSHDLPSGAPSWELTEAVPSCPYCGCNFSFFTRKVRCTHAPQRLEHFDRSTAAPYWTSRRTLCLLNPRTARTSKCFVHSHNTLSHKGKLTPDFASLLVL